MDILRVLPTESEEGHCECCGKVSRTVWGTIEREGSTIAAFFVQWTPGNVVDHGASFDLIVGRWGEESEASDRQAISLVYRILDTGPAFMVVDVQGRAPSRSELVGQTLARADVIGKPIADVAFAVVDAVLSQDARVIELRGRWHIKTD